MSFADQYKIDLGGSSFDFENKVKNGTLREERNNKRGADAASIIEASAGGLDSITNFVSLFTGQQSQGQQTTYVEPQPESRKNMTPWLIGGGVVATLLIIFLLTRQGNGKPTQ